MCIVKAFTKYSKTNQKRLNLLAINALVYIIPEFHMYIFLITKKGITVRAVS